MEPGEAAPSSALRAREDACRAMMYDFCLVRGARLALAAASGSPPPLCVARRSCVLGWRLSERRVGGAAALGRVVRPPPTEARVLSGAAEVGRDARPCPLALADTGLRQQPRRNQPHISQGFGMATDGRPATQAHSVRARPPTCSTTSWC